MKKLVLFLMLSLSMMSIKAFDIPDQRPDGVVFDYANVLVDKTGIQNIINSMREKCGVVVVTVPELGNETIEEFTIKVGDKWKVGKKGEDTGLIYVLSIKDRKHRMEVGRGLQGEITDGKAQSMIDSVKSFYKNKNYDDGVKQILALVSKELNITASTATPTPIASAVTADWTTGDILWFFLILLVILIIVIVIVAVVSKYSDRDDSSGSSGGSLGSFISSSSYDRGSSSSSYTPSSSDSSSSSSYDSSSSSSSYDSGGSFDGGGASGDW